MPVIKMTPFGVRPCKNGAYVGDGFRVDIQWQKQQAKTIVRYICQCGDLPTGILSVDLNDITDDMGDAEKLDVYMENRNILESLDEIRYTLEFFESQKAQNKQLLKELEELDETNDLFLQEIIRLKQILQQHGIPYTAEDKQVEEAVKEKETEITISEKLTLHLPKKQTEVQ